MYCLKTVGDATSLEEILFLFPIHLPLNPPVHNFDNYCYNHICYPYSTVELSQALVTALVGCIVYVIEPLWEPKGIAKYPIVNGPEDSSQNTKHNVAVKEGEKFGLTAKGEQ